MQSNDGLDPHSGGEVDNTSVSSGHSERYSVFKFDFTSVEASYVVSIWIFVASFAKIG